MLHDTQKILLKRLYLRNRQRYGELTQGYDYEDNVAFHLKQLSEKGFITKESGVYSLTTPGIKEVTSYNLPDMVDAGVKSFFIGLLVKYQDKYLVKEHPQTKQNFYNLPSYKPVFGEKIEIALSNAFSSYTSHNIDPKSLTFLSLHLKTVKTSEGEVLFDDAFAIYEITLNSTQYDQVKLTNHTGWMTKEEISKLSNRWPELDICILRNDRSSYLAYELISDYILA